MLHNQIIAQQKPWCGSLRLHLAQCSARFSPYPPVRRTQWLPAPQSAQRGVTHQMIISLLYSRGASLKVY